MKKNFTGLFNYMVMNAFEINFAAMVLSYLSVAIFIFQYYSNFLFPEFYGKFTVFLLSVFIVISLQTLRFTFSLLGAHNAKSGNKNLMLVGFIFSGSITVFEIFEAVLMNNNLGSDASHRLSLLILIIFLILLSQMVEIYAVISLLPTDKSIKTQIATYIQQMGKFNAKEVAEKFQVSKTLVYDIKNGKE